MKTSWQKIMLLVALTLFVSSPVNAAPKEKPMDVQTAVNQLRDFNMQFSPSGRSNLALAEAVNDKDFNVRVWSMGALKALGPAAEVAIPALETACKDKDKAIKVNAKNALKSIKAKK